MPRLHCFSFAQQKLSKNFVLLQISLQNESVPLSIFNSSAILVSECVKSLTFSISPLGHWTAAPCTTVDSLTLFSKMWAPLHKFASGITPSACATLT